MELRPYDEPVKPKRRGGYFLWAVFLLLLAGACFASWIGSFYVIGHPEEPWCYKILKRVNRLDPPKRFAVTEAPRGEFFSPARLLERYGKLGPAELARENAALLRAYLMNYRETKERVAYVVGRFDVVQTYVLSPNDLFPRGVATVTQALEFPQLLLEIVFTAPGKTVQVMRDALPTGGDLTLERSRDLFALIHVARLPDGRMQFSTIPLPYGGWKVKGGGRSFTLSSPQELQETDPKLALNIAAGLPIVRGPRLQEGLDGYVAFRRKALAKSGDDQAALAGPELERFEVSRADPSAAAAKVIRSSPAEAPPPPAPPSGSPSAAPVAPPRAIPTPAPRVELAPRPVVRAMPAPVPPPVVPPPPRAVVAASNRRVLDTAKASAMVGEFNPDLPAALSGDFVVTGVLGQRAALRTRESLRDAQADPARPGTSAALIVVDFPPGKLPPAKDSTISREGENGFAIRDVIRGRNGQITILAVETAP